MKTLRIKKGHFYVLADHPGISGFKDYTRKVETVVTAEKARNHRYCVDREYLASGRGTFRVHDGHLPDYQPRMSEVDALRWLDANPFQGITFLP
jgi:hypothetical protein